MNGGPGVSRILREFFPVIDQPISSAFTADQDFIMGVFGIAFPCGNSLVYTLGFWYTSIIHKSSNVDAKPTCSCVSDVFALYSSQGSI